VQQEEKHPAFGAINVPLAIFWSEPQKEEYEDISRRAASHPAQWAESLDTEQRLWLVGKVNTMAVFGERVAILGQQGAWLNVAAAAQRTRANAWGQAGWVPAYQISQNCLYLAAQLARPEAAIAVPRAMLFGDACLTRPFRWLSYQVRLPILAQEEGFVEVALPGGGKGYLSPGDMERAADLSFSREGIVAQARQFIGLWYLWGGTSSYGFDCSGFTFRLYQSQGICLPRNSVQQSQEGLAVGREDLRPGDLLFFAADQGRGRIHHVAMYVGRGFMIHAPHSRAAIMETSIDAEPYRQEYWGAKRYAC